MNSWYINLSLNSEFIAEDALPEAALCLSLVGTTLDYNLSKSLSSSRRHPLHLLELHSFFLRFTSWI